jgi:archaellum component FlaG (FlaF/FlaG flagellin family)
VIKILLVIHVIIFIVFTPFLNVISFELPSTITIAGGAPISRADYDFSLICENNSHITNGGDATGYIIKIKNTGTQSDTITLDWDVINVTGGTEPDSNEWEAYLNKNWISLAPGSATNVILNVSTGCGCQINTIATIRITGESVNDPGVMTYIDTFTTRGPEQGKVKLEVKDFQVFSELEAGQQVNFKLVVKNPQASKQSFRIKNIRNTGDWQLIFSSSNFEVEALDKMEFDVFFTIPKLNNPHTYELGFRIISNYDPLITDSITIPISLLPELRIGSITPSVKDPVIKERVYFNVIVENIGPAIARSIKIHIYDHINHTIDHLIWQNTIEQLNGSSKVSLNFSWTPAKPGNYNFTAYVDPSNYIEETSNRYANNILVKELKVIEEKPEIPDDTEDSDTPIEMGFIQWSGVVVFIVVVLIFLFLYHRRREKNPSEFERTAKKLPVDNKKGNYGRVSPRNSRYGKTTARKIRMDGSGPHKKSGHVRYNQRYNKKRKR